MNFNILASYIYADEATLKGIGEVKEKYPTKFFLDSGAFSAMTLNKTIDLPDYLAYIDRNKGIIDEYFVLDVIGDKEKTLVNYKIMKDKGYEPIPIFTTGGTYEELQYYCDTSEIVGIGGVAGWGNNPDCIAYLKDTFAHLPEGKKIHILGIATEKTLKYFKPYSADSSNAWGACRYGRMSLWDPKNYFYSIHRKEFGKRPSEKVMDLIRGHGSDPCLLAKKESWSGRGEAQKITFRAHLRFGDYYEQNHNVRIFLAVPGRYWLDVLVQEFENEQSGKTIGTYKYGNING